MSTEEKFSFDTVKDFDKHIDVSIPNYSFVAKQVGQLTEYFSEENTGVYDLGCSTGKWLLSLKAKPNVKYYGFDISRNLLPNPNQVKLDRPDMDLEFQLQDITKLDWTKLKRPSVVVSLFTLQFLSLEHRKKIIRDVSDVLIPGGVFISCEKVYSENSKFQDITNSIYYEFKRQSFSGDEILSKEQDLRTMMRLQSVEQSVREMRIVGHVEMFWRSYNFVGLTAIKPSH